MYYLKIIPILISVDFYNSKKYVLSLDSSKIIFPTIECKNISNIKEFVINEICKYFVDDITIRSYINNIKFIDINNENILNINHHSNDTIFLTYGVTVPKLIVKEYFWTSFDFIDMNHPNESAIIGKTIQYNVK